MMFPPSVLTVRRVKNGRKRLGLVIPLVLIWPILLLTVAALTPMVVAVMLARRCNGGAKAALLAGPLLLGLFCAARGLEVDVQDGRKRMVIRVV